MIMNIYEKFCNYRAKRRISALRQEAERLIQIREFCGEVYLSFDNMPILHESSLNLPICAAVKKARENYFAYVAQRDSINI